MSNKTQMQVAFVCPWCKKEYGFFLTRSGAVANAEKAGRKDLPCGHCGKPISVEIVFNINKGE